MAFPEQQYRAGTYLIAPLAVISLPHQELDTNGKGWISPPRKSHGLLGTACAQTVHRDGILRAFCSGTTAFVARDKLVRPHTNMADQVYYPFVGSGIGASLAPAETCAQVRDTDFANFGHRPMTSLVCITDCQRGIENAIVQSNTKD